MYSEWGRPEKTSARPPSVSNLRSPTVKVARPPRMTARISRSLDSMDEV
jgi:hypothetical protein